MLKYIIFLLVLCIPVFVFGEVDPEPPSMDLIDRILEWLRGRNTFLAGVIIFIIEFIMRRKRTEKPVSLLKMASDAMDKVAPQNCRKK